MSDKGKNSHDSARAARDATNKWRQGGFAPRLPGSTPSSDPRHSQKKLLLSFSQTPGRFERDIEVYAPQSGDGGRLPHTVRTGYAVDTYNVLLAPIGVEIADPPVAINDTPPGVSLQVRSTGKGKLKCVLALSKEHYLTLCAAWGADPTRTLKSNPIESEAKADLALWEEIKTNTPLAEPPSPPSPPSTPAR